MKNGYPLNGAQDMNATTTSLTNKATSTPNDQLERGEMHDLVEMITERLTNASDNQLRELIRAVFASNPTCGTCEVTGERRLSDTDEFNQGGASQCAMGENDLNHYLIVDESRGPASGEFSVRVLRSYGSFTLTDPLPTCLQVGPPVRRMHQVPLATSADRYTVVRHGSLLLEAVGEYSLTTSTHAASEGVSASSEPGTVISARKWSSMRKIPSILVEERWIAEENRPANRFSYISAIMAVLAEGQQVLFRSLGGELKVLEPVEPGTSDRRFVRLR